MSTSSFVSAALGSYCPEVLGRGEVLGRCVLSIYYSIVAIAVEGKLGRGS